MKNETQEKTEQKKQRWVVGEVPTQVQPVVVDTEDKNPETQVYTIEQSLVEILNGIEELRSLL